MHYRTIAVHVNDSRHASDRMTLAAELAAASDAHLVGVAATGVPEAFYMPEMMDGAVVLPAYLELMKKRAGGALAQFEKIADRSGLSSFEKRVMEEESGVALCLQARYSDLVIIGQDDPDEALPGQRADMPEYVVMNSARPVLIVPYCGKFGSVGRRAVVAWDGGMEAARAVALALPFLKAAQQVEVVVFNPESEPHSHGTQPGADIALYLARHGIKVEVSQQTADGDVDIGNALLSHLADVGADLLVMGGYGHSRFREILLGGVTRTILRSMTVPVLMAH
jgi:nucleotide-binding universal stress UspA family protein